jgi:hypothetical protein
MRDGGSRFHAAGLLISTASCVHDHFNGERSVDVARRLRTTSRGAQQTAICGGVYADESFSGAVERHLIYEDSRRLTDRLVLSIFWWTDESPLEDIVKRDERRSYRRSDERDD